MSNMSYCRFQNTRGDLEDCQWALDEMVEALGDDGGDDENNALDLSREEASAALRLIEMAQDIATLADDETLMEFLRMRAEQ